MSRLVSHTRPELTDGIRAGLPVGAFDWGGYAALAHWSNGHGGMLIPWASIGQDITTGNTGTFLFFVAPKKLAVERVWQINMHSSAAIGVTAAVTVGGASASTREVYELRNGRGAAYLFRESLGAKTETAAQTGVAIAVTGGTVTVESIACYEQTRGVLDADTTDRGVEFNTLRARDPILDLPNKSLAGVIDAYKALDARRSGYFHWSTDVSSALAVTAGQGRPDDVFDLSVPMAGAIPTLGDTTMDVVCAVNCKVPEAATGFVRFQSDDAGDSVTVTQTDKNFSWVTGNLTINAEDLTITDGRRGNSWEGVAITAHVTASDTLNIQAISIYRGSVSNPI